MALTATDKQWLDSRFATKDDLKKELKKLATKSDLAASNVRLGLEFDKKFENLSGEMTRKHDEVMTVLDKIMTEVVKGREQYINH